MLEGVVAKRRSSFYEPGRRSGAWVKLRVNRRHDFIVGGYLPRGRNFDSILVGYYEGRDLKYAGSVRADFTPASREALFNGFSKLELAECPFSNLPEASKGRWGTGITADKVKACVWLKLRIVVAIGEPAGQQHRSCGEPSSRSSPRIAALGTALGNRIARSERRSGRDRSQVRASHHLYHDQLSAGFRTAAVQGFRIYELARPVAILGRPPTKRVRHALLEMRDG